MPLLLRPLFPSMYSNLNPGHGSISSWVGCTSTSPLFSWVTFMHESAESRNANMPACSHVAGIGVWLLVYTNPFRKDGKKDLHAVWLQLAGHVWRVTVRAGTAHPLRLQPTSSTCCLAWTLCRLQSSVALQMQAGSTLSMAVCSSTCVLMHRS